MCLTVSCHLHFWQNDRHLLRATVVTQGCNGYQNKSQHRKSTLEKKILPPLQQGFEPATFLTTELSPPPSYNNPPWHLSIFMTRTILMCLYMLSPCNVQSAISDRELKKNVLIILVYAALAKRSRIHNYNCKVNVYVCELVWPSGKAGKRKDLGSIPLRLSFLFKKVVVCGHCLVTLSITSY